MVEERAGIPKSQAREDSIVYTLYDIPRYATVVGCAGFTKERLQQVVAVACLSLRASGASRRLIRSGFMLGPVVL